MVSLLLYVVGAKGLNGVGIEKDCVESSRPTGQGVDTKLQDAGGNMKKVLGEKCSFPLWKPKNE